MKIVDLRATTVTVPLEAPLRHANGCHWGRFVRTIVQVETDEGLVGLGEMGGRGESAEAAGALKQRYGFTSHKLKGGVFPPEYELECYRALAVALKGDRFRFDPNGVWSTETAISFGQQIEEIRNDYLEDPVFGLTGMRRVREKVRLPLATNTVVVNFEQLAANILDTGGKFKYANGAIEVPTASGLGVKVDRDKVAEYRELYQRLGSYPYDQDPLRRGWTPTIPNDRWADPLGARVPRIGV